MKYCLNKPTENTEKLIDKWIGLPIDIPQSPNKRNYKYSIINDIE